VQQRAPSTHRLDLDRGQDSTREYTIMADETTQTTTIVIITGSPEKSSLVPREYYFNNIMWYNIHQYDVGILYTQHVSHTYMIL